MIQRVINYIPDDAVLWATVTGCMLFPLGTPIWLCTAMILTCCKSRSFMDEEADRFELVQQLMLDELDSDYSSDDETVHSDEESDSRETEEIEMNTEKLRNEIKKLEDEINTMRTIMTDNTEVIDFPQQKSSDEKKND